MQKVKSMVVVTILLMVFVLGNQVLAGQVITVDDDGPADYSTIQDAIDAAVDGDTVVVADGIYTGQGNKNIDFGGRAITVKSENGPENCIVDCQGTEADPHRGFYFHNDEDSNSVLDGLTIKNGYANTGGGILGEQVKPVITNCVITGNVTQYNGGGISTCDGLITNCTISENSAGDRGGGLYRCDGQISNCTIKDNLSLDSGGGGLYDCDGPINDCIITGNSAISDISYHGLGGGLRYCDGTISDCVISSNYAQYLGGGLEWCSGSIKSCTVSNNSSGYSGGGIHRCYGLITNCVILNNSAGTLGGGLCGVGSLNNCTISGNSSGQWGGGLYYCEGAITDCIFVDNMAQYGGALADCKTPIINCNFINNVAEEKGGGLIYCDSLITNGIFVNNTKQAIYEIPYAYVSKTHSPAVSYCLFYDNPDGDWYDLETSSVVIGAEAINCFLGNDNNLDIDPLFESGSFRLQTGSPCINAGDPNYIPEVNETDLDGGPRVIGGRIDMGAYEALRPVDLLVELSDGIDAMDLGKGTVKSLQAKLDTAMRLLEDDNENNDIAAINSLQAFINAVEAQRGKKISETDDDALIIAVQEIIELLEENQL
jgi:predicted outer membrane repeat protein